MGTIAFALGLVSTSLDKLAGGGTAAKFTVVAFVCFIVAASTNLSVLKFVVVVGLRVETALFFVNFFAAFRPASKPSGAE